MPDPATWDTFGLAYDSGVTWDSLVASKTKSMNTIKAIIDFSSYTAAELGPVAQAIQDSMTTNAATFTTPPVTMTALQTLITTYNTKLVARASNAKGDVIAFNEARVALEDALGVLGNYVNVVAKGSATIVEQSGFPSYDTSRPANPAPPAAPTNLRVRQGELSGSIVARYKPDRHASTNEVQINTGDPNTEANWHLKGIYQGGKAEMDGLTPGAVVWVRVRTVGLKGVMGAWSDPGQIRVI